ncbi:unnamed protein product [Musa acuminata var. zebrina]
MIMKYLAYFRVLMKVTVHIFHDYIHRFVTYQIYHESSHFHDFLFFFNFTLSCWSNLFFLSGAEVAVLCITKSGDVLNYQAFTNLKGIYKVAETMPESDRWVSCLARPVSSFHEHCTQRGDAHSGIKFSYNRPSGHSHTVKPFLYKPASTPLYCS